MLPMDTSNNVLWDVAISTNHMLALKRTSAFVAMITANMVRDGKINVTVKTQSRGNAEEPGGCLFMRQVHCK